MTYIRGVQASNLLSTVISVTLGYPEVRRAIRDGLSQMIIEQFGNVDIVSGTATAGILMLTSLKS